MNVTEEKEKMTLSHTNCLVHVTLARSSVNPDYPLSMHYQWIFISTHAGILLGIDPLDKTRMYFSEVGGL
jgi:hypothetical protein